MTGKTILVADDEAHILHVVSLKLANAGFEVITARDGDEAFESLATTPVDLVITDFQMPGMTGLELARRVHRTPGKSQLPMILLTAHGLALEQVELNHAGISACLSKPFSPRELLARVYELLASAQAAAQAAPQNVAVNQ